MQRDVWRATGQRALGAIRSININGTFEALESVNGTGVIITNTSGKDVKYRRGNAGFWVTIPNGAGKIVDISSNASEIQVANATDNTAIDVVYEIQGESV